MLVDVVGGRRWRRLPAAAVAACAVALFAPAAALATTQTASAGNVTASFSYQGTFPQFSHETLTIRRAGRVAYHAPVSSSLCLGACAPGALGAGTHSVHALDLEHDGRPDVVLDLFSGGAHCCSIEQIFSYDAVRKTYVKSERNFGDPGAEIVDLAHNGRFEFLTADDRFAYEWTSFAASGLPVQVLTFSGGRFNYATRSYPKLIARDAATWLNAFHATAQNGYQESEGTIAAWAADEELLGHGALVDQYLAQQATAGHLNGDVVDGHKFISALHTFLRKLNYIR